ncbi:MAG TPA: hypothetical protein VFS88_07075 [Micavibrio sp.]|nr:hypothetical protein [Micavibrio sp.]
MNKPGAISLAKQSGSFVFDNMNMLMRHLRYLFPLLALLSFAEAFCAQQEVKWVPIALLIPNFIFLSLFVLSWHRASLRGTGEDHSINPFDISQYDFRFIGVMFTLALVPLAAGVVFGAAAGILTKIAGLPDQTEKALFLLLGVPLIALLLITMVKMYFVLPARSVGVKLGFGEARKISKGMVWPVIGANILFSTGMALAVILCGGVLGFVLYVVTGQEANWISKYIVSLVGLLFGLVYIALNVTALSRAYRWGAENNSSV